MRRLSRTVRRNSARTAPNRDNNRTLARSRRRAERAQIAVSGSSPASGRGGNNRERIPSSRASRDNRSGPGSNLALNSRAVSQVGNNRAVGKPVNNLQIRLPKMALRVGNSPASKVKTSRAIRHRRSAARVAAKPANVGRSPDSHKIRKRANSPDSRTGNNAGSKPDRRVAAAELVVATAPVNSSPERGSGGKLRASQVASRNNGAERAAETKEAAPLVDRPTVSRRGL
jgi:hypothetical protein